jgi:hypothetical protein
MFLPLYPTSCNRRRMAYCFCVGFIYTCKHDVRGSPYFGRMGVCERGFFKLISESKEAIERCSRDSLSRIRFLCDVG